MTRVEGPHSFSILRTRRINLNILSPGYREVTGSNLVEVLNFFFRLLYAIA